MKTPHVHELRGCELCSHSQAGDTELQCTEPTVAGALRRVPCRIARYGSGFDQAGGCGRDAQRMHWAAIDMPIRQRAPSWA